MTRRNNATEADSSDAETLRGSAYPPAWRLVATVLRVISSATLPVLLLLLLTVDDPPLAPPILLPLFALWVVVPASAAWLIHRAFAVDIRTTPTTLLLARRDRQIEVPFDALQQVRPWRVPLPAPGVSFTLRSGKRLGWGIALPDPGRLVARCPARPPVPNVALDPSLAFAHARAVYASHGAVHQAAKFVGFALLPAAVLFYTHQHIAYGGSLGEYYLLGLGSYLQTFAVYWSTIIVYLMLYASAWRGVAEVVCLLTAWSAPQRSVVVRYWAERCSALLFYGGVPVILALRYMA